MGGVSEGMRFGRLEARSPAQLRAGRSHWLCRCECGAWPVVSAQGLLGGGTRSCGCLRREATRARCLARVPDLTGARFGRWLVLRRAEREPVHGTSRWWCRCECGLEASVSQGHLRSGQTRGCGPCARARRRIRDAGVPVRAAGEGA